MGSSHGVLYSLRKAHKSGCPLRPSYRFFCKHNHNLTSCLVLDTLARFSFADWAERYKHKNEVMCSFDVSSLFRNVTLDETIQIQFRWQAIRASWFANTACPVVKVLLEYATKKEPFHIWWPDWWCGNGLPCFNVPFWGEIGTQQQHSPFYLVSICWRYFHLVRQQ